MKMYELPEEERLTYFSDTLNTHTTRLHTDVIQATEHLTTLCTAHAKLEEAADIVYHLKKASEYLDDCRKAIDRLKKVYTASACMLALESGSTAIPPGNVAKGYLKSYTSFKQPSYSKEPEAYNSLCVYLGLEPSPYTRIHFPTLKDHVTELSAKGALPKALEPYKQYTETVIITSPISPGDHDEDEE